MNTSDFRKLINIINESRNLDNPDIEYKDETDKVIANLKSYNSQTYTKLAQKIQRMALLKEEIKVLEDEVKDIARSNIADLFDAEDAVKTRIVDTVSFIFKLTKDPALTISPKYKEILSELEKHLTPQLIAILEALKKQLTTETQKSPALSLKPKDAPALPKLDEAVGGIFSRFKEMVFDWAKSYDRRLNHLKALAAHI